MEKIVMKEEHIANRLKEEILLIAKEAIAENGLFVAGFSGGSLVKFLNATFKCVDNRELQKWKIFLCDERYDSPDSILGTYKEKYPSIANQIEAINYNLPLEECAKDYERRILNIFGKMKGESVEFDLIVLGMGEDGHICSLFPEHNLLDERDCLVAALDNSPKPPSKRITITYPLINSAKRVVFVVTGGNKAEIVKKVFLEHEPLPAARVKPNILKGIFDEAAGELLEIETEPPKGPILRGLLEDREKSYPI